MQANKRRGDDMTDALRMTALNDGPLDCEFVPPLDAPETWGIPWDRQLAAALAWQQAAGNDDAPACAAERSTGSLIVPSLDDAASTSRSGQSKVVPIAHPALTMRTIVRMNTLLVSLRERMLQITTDASNIAIAEMARRQDAAMPESAIADAPAVPALHPDHAARITELARAWFDVVADAQASMTALTGLAPRDAAGTRPGTAANDGTRPGERRH
ncbi:MAG TPA: hypothetical protein PL143_19650, partial [Rhodocyclaceae bacterium]|nr:hypothetical protein [Rhodocyclaceae bacterium]